MVRHIAFVLCGVALACGSTTTPDTADAAISTRPFDPSCVTIGPCPVWDCKCTSASGGRTSNTDSDACISAETSCKKYCDGYGQALKTPVECIKRADAGPPVDAATPEEGRPGGACYQVGEKCFVAMCECNNGSMLTPVTGVCSTGVCLGQGVACPPACADRGGWSGRGRD